MREHRLKCKISSCGNCSVDPERTYEWADAHRYGALSHLYAGKSIRQIVTELGWSHNEWPSTTLAFPLDPPAIFKKEASSSQFGNKLKRLLQTDRQHKNQKRVARSSSGNDDELPLLSDNPE